MLLQAKPAHTATSSKVLKPSVRFHDQPVGEFLIFGGHKQQGQPVLGSRLEFLAHRRLLQLPACGRLLQLPAQGDSQLGKAQDLVLAQGALTL